MASEKQQYECSMGLKNSGAQGMVGRPFHELQTNKANENFYFKILRSQLAVSVTKTVD